MEGKMENKIEKIGIRFSDNDFATVIETFLELIGNGYKRNGKIELSKEDITNIFNSIAGNLYWLVQDSKTYNLSMDYVKQFPDYDYLTITEKNVFINEEVEEYISKLQKYGGGPWDNGEFQWVELLEGKDRWSNLYRINCI